MAINLNADRALVFRITHVNNVRWILENGLHCKNAGVVDPDFVRIGNPELISKRSTRAVPIQPGGHLSDYIPFYFTPFSMMLLNIITGYRGIRQFPNTDIAILVSSLHRLENQGITTLFTDRHAYLRTAQFFDDTGDLDQINWDILRRRDFKHDPDDPEKTDRYQAEALVHQHLPIQGLRGIVCHSENIKRTLDAWAEELGIEIDILVKPSWYF